MWDILDKIATLVTLATFATLIVTIVKWYKSREMSLNKLEKKIARVCRKKGMYRLEGNGDLGLISDQITKEYKHHLPEGFDWQYRDDRVAAIARFLTGRGWEKKPRPGITDRRVFEVPDRLRRPT